jgi:hypothetical protein
VIVSEYTSHEKENASAPVVREEKIVSVRALCPHQSVIVPGASVGTKVRIEVDEHEGGDAAEEGRSSLDDDSRAIEQEAESEDVQRLGEKLDEGGGAGEEDHEVVVVESALLGRRGEHRERKGGERHGHAQRHDRPAQVGQLAFPLALRPLAINTTHTRHRTISTTERQ